MLSLMMMLTGEKAVHKDRQHARWRRTVWWDPNAGGQHVCESPDKPLVKRQGLLIPWYLEDKDCDYLHVPRLVAAPAANAASPSSSLGSFEM